MLIEGPSPSNQLVRITPASPPLPPVFLGNRFAMLANSNDL